MTTSFFPSPLGVLQINCENGSLTTINFSDEEIAPYNTANEINEQVHFWLNSYFSGEEKELNFSISARGTTFQKRVWELLLDIPFGRTVSYKQLSLKYGDLNAIRAVAGANGANPIPIIIPCHRVIGGDGSLVGFSGGLNRKSWLLKHEARFTNGIKELFA